LCKLALTGEHPSSEGKGLKSSENFRTTMLRRTEEVMRSEEELSWR
jgi:hypothetical protein